MIKRVKGLSPQGEDSFVAGDRPPLIPAGEYRVQCLECKEFYYKTYNSIKLRLKFRIIEGEHEGTVLFKYINLTDSRTKGKYKKFSPNTEYYKNWVIANNENLPPRNRMPYTIFKDGIFEAKVRNAKRRFQDGMEMPECFNYSVIAYLIKRLA